MSHMEPSFRQDRSRVASLMGRCVLFVPESPDGRTARSAGRVARRRRMGPRRGDCRGFGQGRRGGKKTREFPILFSDVRRELCMPNSCSWAPLRAPDAPFQHGWLFPPHLSLQRSARPRCLPSPAADFGNERQLLEKGDRDDDFAEQQDLSVRCPDVHRAVREQPDWRVSLSVQLRDG